MGKPHIIEARIDTPKLSCTVLLLLCTALLAAAPGLAQEPSQRAGVPVVVSTRPLWETRSTWRIEPSPTVRIGVLEGPEDYQFHGITALLRLPDGLILVGNGGTNEVRLYDSRGRFMRSFGGAGGGPGEFRAISGFAVVESSLLVYDARQGRLTRFDLNGGSVATVRLEPTGDSIYHVGHYRLAGSIEPGRLVFVPWAFDAPPKPIPTRFWDSVRNLLYDADGKYLGAFAGSSGMDMYGEPGLGTQIRLGAYSARP